MVTMEGAVSTEPPTTKQRTKVVPSASHSLRDFDLDTKSPNLKYKDSIGNKTIDIHVRLRGRAALLYNKVNSNKPLPYGWLATVVNPAVLEALEILARNRGLE